MSNALPNVTGDSFRITEEVLQAGIEASRTSERLRIILPLHRSQDAPVQRMLNFFQPGTYVRPHLHSGPGAIETICVLRGALGFVLLDETGQVTETHRLEPDSLGVIDIEPQVWHGMVALQPDTVILEIKCGPYSAMSDKDFAPWAPEEGEPGTGDIVRQFEGAFL